MVVDFVARLSLLTVLLLFVDSIVLPCLLVRLVGVCAAVVVPVTIVLVASAGIGVILVTVIVGVVGVLITSTATTATTAPTAATSTGIVVSSTLGGAIPG